MVNNKKVQVIIPNQNVFENEKNEIFNLDCFIGLNKELVSQNNESLFWVIDLNYRLLKYNKAFEDILFNKYSMAISVGESVLELNFEADLLKKWESLYDNAFKGESFVINGSTIINEKQKKLQYNTTIKPLYDINNVIIGAYCSVIDFNIKKHSEQVILDEKLLIAQLNEYDEAVIVFEIENLNDYKIKFVNNQFLKLTRIKGDIIDKNLQDFVNENKLPLLLKKYNEAIALKNNIVWQEKLSIGNRSETVLINLKPIFCSESKCTNLIVIISKLHAIIDSTLDYKNIKHVLSKAFKFSNDIICTLDKDGNFILVSEACSKILGYSPRELSGTNFINYVYELDKVKTKNVEQTIQNGQPTSSFENRYIHKNGSIVNILWSAHWDDEEKIMYSIARDITEYKTIIKKTIVTENLLNEAQRFSKMGSWNYDFKQNLLSWSDALYEVFGTDKMLFDSTCESFLDFVIPGEREFVDQTIKNCELLGESFNIIYKIITPRGENRVIEAFGCGELDSDGNVIRIYGTAQDISERKKIEKSLEKSNQKYKYLFQNNPVPLFIFDFATLQIVDCNIEALLLYGYTRENFLKLTILDIRPKEDIDLILEATSSEEKYGKIHKKIWRHKKKNGDLFYVDVTAHIIDYENRKCSIVLVIDVTEKIELGRKEKERIQFIETTLENLPIGIAVNTIEEGTATLMNHKFSEIYGWPKEILTDFKTFFENVYPDKEYRDELVQKIVGDIQSKDSKKMNWDGINITTQKGEKRIINAKNIPLYDQNLMISVVVDVTDKYNFQKSLEQSNERYRYASMATSDAIWDWDLLSDSFYWGEGINLLFGYQYISNETHSGKTWFDLIHSDDYLIILYDINEALKSDILNWTCEHRVTNNDGSVSFVNQKATIIRDATGKAIRLVGAIQDISERKRREQQLKLFESVVTNANDAVIITEAESFAGADNGIIYVNDAFTKMTGYTLQDVVGQNPRFLQGPKTDYVEIKRLGKAIRSWQACEITTINYDKAGNEFWSNFAIAPVANEQGWFTNWVSIQRDVTHIKIEERKRELISEINTLFNKTDTLQETTNILLKKIATIFDYPVTALWLLDEEQETLNLVSYHYKESGKINLEKFLNNALVHHYKDKQKGVLGAAWESGKIVKWSLNSKEFDLFLENEIIESGIQKMTAIPIIFNTIVIGIILIGEDEDKIRYDDKIIVSDEIGLHLGAEIKRKQLEQELSKIFNFSPDVVSVINNSGKFKRINPAGCTLFGYDEQELLQMNITDLVHPEDFDKAKKKILVFIKKEQTVYFESRFITSDKSIRWMAWTASSTEDGFIYSIGKDITDRKKSENQLKLLNQDLLKQTKKLHISNEELEQFAYVASHDLQEPLRMVTSFLTLIENKYHDKLDDKGLGYIKFAVEGAKNMRQIILDLLNFSRISDNESSFENIELAEIINDVCLMQSKLISEKNAKIQFEDLPNIYSIRHYLIQLFQNLISNALKYSKQNVPLQIIISSKNYKTHYLLSVTDNGIGIEKEYFDKIFVIFQRLHRKDEYQGNGMGLAITKKIMDKLNGKIWVDSELGIGSTFNIMIPKKNKKI